jgi:hypothetical protein
LSTCALEGSSPSKLCLVHSVSLCPRPSNHLTLPLTPPFFAEDMDLTRARYEADTQERPPRDELSSLWWDACTHESLPQADARQLRCGCGCQHLILHHLYCLAYARQIQPHVSKLWSIDGHAAEPDAMFDSRQRQKAGALPMAAAACMGVSHAAGTAWLAAHDCQMNPNPQHRPGPMPAQLRSTLLASHR